MGALRSLIGYNSRYPKVPKRWLPDSERKQIFLPNFTITLIRTPFLPPRYASFYVPLNFNKLDMRDYMRRVYNVKVLRVRSFVEQQKVTRDRKDGTPGYGPLRRPKSKKRMTIEMTEPFVWPEAPQDLSAWEKEQYFKAAEYQEEAQKANQPKAAMEPKKDEREAFAEQAKAMLEGRTAWRPTWQALGLNYGKPVVPTPPINKATSSLSTPPSKSASDSSKPTSSPVD